MKNQICPHCKNEIPAGFVQQGGLHMWCYDDEIDVWFISLPGDPKNGFYENDMCQIAQILCHMEDQYQIEKRKMKAGRFYNLPEFAGF